MKHLISIEELKTIGRPIGKVSEEKLNAFISEAEQLHIKPIIGDTLFLQLINECGKQEIGDNTPETPENDGNTTDKEDIESPTDGKNEDLQTLLNGGTYYTRKGCEDEQIRSFLGLKIAISYFVNAQIIMVGDFESTRYGTVVKNGDYSDHLSSKERSDAYNNTLEVANGYLQECVDYCKAVGLIKRVQRPKVSFGGVTIRRIG